MNNELIEKIKKIKAVRTRLKCGEYNGNDIMQAWIAIDELIKCKATLSKYEAQQQLLIGRCSRLQIEISIAESLIEDPNYEMSAMDFEYENSWHDKLKAALAQRHQAAEPDTEANLVADALEAADWSGVPIGNKCFIRSAIEHLRAAQPQVPEGYVLVPIRPLETVLRISDREHEAWDAVKAATLSAEKEEGK